ncbi:MAG: protein-L-isoaspartate(D-aspartate) O-methyltransferase [Chloroflexota bacterium]|nr:protein-L-isoaspartate(D-aspartate) O-methyltransferase [Chloroflexota bacterium]
MDFTRLRLQLIDHLSYSIADQRVLEAIAKVPRERFVPEPREEDVYANVPLPIGFGQTISQPLMVAVMTEALTLNGTERVLEIGTGSGYQTAILAELSRYVVTVERYPGLLDRATRVLQELGYHNIETHLSQDSLGWEQGGPYDSIIATAGAPRVPQVLLNQLSVEGTLVIPVGSRHDQELVRIVKRDRSFIRQELGSCRFVPLIGNDAWDEYQY